MAPFQDTQSVGGISGYAGNSAIPSQPGQPKENQGSLASAFEELNREISKLEETGKRLFEKINPILEPSAPTPSATQQPPLKAASPLADSVFEYAARVRQARQGFSEIADRISF